MSGAPTPRSPLPRRPAPLPICPFPPLPRNLYLTMHHTRTKLLYLLPVAAALGVLLALAACGGDDDGEPGASPTPAPATTGPAGETPSTTVEPGTNCNPGGGPPREGLAQGLEGRVSFVRLVFGCQPDVYIMNADGSEATQLTDNPALDDEADLSPDGEKVVFSSAREGATSIYVMNADGGDLVRLTRGSGDVSPRWSPDGERIAFSQAGNLAVMNADGSGIKIVMPGQSPETAPLCESAPIVGGWSPDNKHVTYYEGIPGTTGSSGATPRPDRYNVCAVDVETGEVQVLVSEPAGKLHAEPHWSPDGKKIAFRDDRDSNCFPGSGSCNYEVYVLDLETGEETNVTNNPALDIEPVWSPDGEWIMFASNREDVNFDLYVIHPDGAGLQRVLDDPEAKDSYPSWR